MAAIKDIQIYEFERDDGDYIVMFYEDVINSQDLHVELHPDNSVWLYKYDEAQDEIVVDREISLREFLQEVLSR